MNFTPQLLNKFLRLWKVRGAQVTSQLQVIIQLSANSPVDLGPVTGPAILFEQTFALCQATMLDFIMGDDSFSSFSLDLQHELAKSAVAWSELFATAANIAFRDRTPTFGALLSTTPSAQIFNAQAQSISTAVDIKLESFMSVPLLAGLTVGTFWSAPQDAISALSRLIIIDYVVSKDPTVYYGPNATLNDIIADAMLVLERMGPLVPDPNAILAQINAAIAAGYSETEAVSVTTMILPQSASLRQIAAQVYGDPDQYVRIANFNGLVYPFFSDDPIERLGPPVQIGATLTELALAGTTTLKVTGLGVFSTDQRLLIQHDEADQIVTIIGGAFNSPDSPLNWDMLGDIDLEQQVYTIEITPPLTVGCQTNNTTISLYPAVYDAGKVLGTGDLLLVPVQPKPRMAFVIDTSLTDPQRFGTDIYNGANGDLSTPNGDLTITNGDLTTVMGIDCLEQSLLNMFRVVRGTLIHHPLYGTLLPTFIGKTIRPALPFLITVDVTQTVLQDPRAVAIQAVDVSGKKGDAIEATFNVADENGVLLFPTDLEVTVPTEPT